MTLPKDLPTNLGADHRFKTAEAFYVGEALITPSLNRIEVQGTQHQIEPKVMRVLLLLCTRPGHVVYRDQILQPIWGQTGDDYLLNRAISELRKIFSDNAQNPAYIETIRKTGYRLVAPIKPVASATLVTEKPKAAKPTAPQTKTPEELPTEQATPPITAKSFNRNWLMAGALGVLLAVLLGSNLLNKPRPFSIDHYQVYPATNFPGHEYDAALSPDGTRIAYIADGPEVFTKMLRGEQALQLSQNEGQVSSPRWVPDGQGIVYAGLIEPRLRFLRVPPLGGARQTLYEEDQAFGIRGLSIASDGERLVYAKRSSPGGAHQLWLLSIKNGERVQLTDPTPGTLGDTDPLFAPDGKSVIFVRGSDEVTKDLYQLKLADKSLTRLTHDNRKINGVAWSPDGNHLLFTSTRSGIYRLWSIEKKGGEPQPLSLGWESVQRPVTALGVDALVFEDWKHTAKLVAVDLANPQVQPLKLSLRWDSNPSISPDGKSLVFASNRGGPFGIWRSELDSDGAYEWANLDGAFIDNPTWSPDGSQIVFDASPEGRTQLYLLDNGSSAPRHLSLGNFDNRTPAWSRDGKWIYFESNRDGTWQLYAWRVGSEEIRPIAAKEGRNPQESVDGEWLLYAGNENIWRCRKTACLEAAEQGTNEVLISGITENDIYNWTPASDGIYFIQRSQNPASLPELAFFYYADGNIKTLTTLTRDFRGWGMTLSPDESKLFLTEMAQPGSDIKVARP